MRRRRRQRWRHAPRLLGGAATGASGAATNGIADVKLQLKTDKHTHHSSQFCSCRIEGFILGPKGQSSFKGKVAPDLLLSFLASMKRSGLKKVSKTIKL